MDFNDLWFNHAMLMAKKSKDPRTKVGAVIVNQDNRQLVSSGYNGPPRGFEDDRLDNMTKPNKALVCEHAERNAIYNAARLGMTTNNCDIYVTLTPCNECARAIIQSGIKTIWVPWQFSSPFPDILGNLVETKVVKEIKWEISSILVDGEELELKPSLV